MAERMIIEPVKRIAENYLETRNKVIENCWRMIVGNDTPKQEDGWLATKPQTVYIDIIARKRGKVNIIQYGGSTNGADNERVPERIF